MTTPTEPSPAGTKKPAKITAKRVGWVALNIFLPASESVSLARYTGRNLAQLWQRLRDATARRPADDYRPDSWAQAVADSGTTPARLARHYRRSRWLWWGLMWLTGGPALGLLLMLLVAGTDVNVHGWLRAVGVWLVLAGFAANGFVQVLKVNYRLWQLNEKRVSASEKGSFRAFLQETLWCRQVLSAGLCQPQR